MPPMIVLYRAALASFLLGFHSSNAKSPQQILDLTDRKSETSIGIPAFTSHSGGKNPDEVVNIDVTINLLSAKLNENGDLQVEVSLINKSGLPLAVPLSLDQKKVHKEGCHDRIEMVFLVEDPEKSQPQSFVSVLETLYGSGCDADSYKTLSSGGSLVLRLSVSRVVVRVDAGKQISVSVRLFRFAESGFRISASSSVSTSNSAIVQGSGN
jgi:hypothetical protein